MNLHSWFNRVASAVNRAGADIKFFRQIRPGSLSSACRMKLLSVCAETVAVCFAVALLTAVSTASAQTNYYSANGYEYGIVGSLPGDQMFPDAAISPTNGFIVWQDNATDGAGWGVSARRVDSTLSGTLSSFRVNVTAAGDQENPRVALLKNGGAAFVWQGGTEGFQRIYGRFLTPTNTFLTTTDLVISTFIRTNSFQVTPAMTVLNDSNVVVVWTSFNQAGTNSLMDVYAKILSPGGLTISNEFLVNQFTNYNQRTPSVAALKGGGFVVTWVSEQQQAVAPVLQSNSVYYASAVTPSVNIYARLYQSNGVPVTGEFNVDGGNNSACGNPRVAAASDGGFMVVWSQITTGTANGWDVYGRPFTKSGVGGAIGRINTYLKGNQYIPQISAIGLDYLVLWTSWGQDGSREGVYGQFVHNDGSLVGTEFRVNTTTVGQQMQPVVASDGVSQFLAVWTSYTGSPYSFDLFAQRFMNVSSILQPMAAPYVWVPFVVSNNVYQPQLMVSWPALLGLSVTNYEVYVDGNSTPTAVVSGNSWTMTSANGLTASSTHAFALDYVTTDGRRSPISPSASGTTWGGLNWGGIPSEWMIAYYGSDISQWPAPGYKLTPNMTVYQVFLSGGNPLDANTWLTQQFVKTDQGMFLIWNTQPGATYQVQLTTDFKTWSNWGAARFAAGSADSINVGGNNAGYYRVVLMR